MSEKQTNEPHPVDLPGSQWRISASKDGEKVEVEDQGVLDEVVIQPWLHLEQLDDREWWMRLGDARILINVAADGKVQVDVERGYYHEVSGETTIR